MCNGAGVTSRTPLDRRWQTRRSSNPPTLTVRLTAPTCSLQQEIANYLGMELGGHLYKANFAEDTDDAAFERNASAFSSGNTAAKTAQLKAAGLKTGPQ